MIFVEVWTTRFYECGMSGEAAHDEIVKKKKRHWVLCDPAQRLCDELMANDPVGAENVRIVRASERIPS